MRLEHDRRTDVRRKIRELWKIGRVNPTHHADERFRESGLADRDVWNVLKHGAIFKVDAPRGVARYHLRGKSFAGDWVVCPVEIEGDELIIVTVFLEKLS